MLSIVLTGTGVEKCFRQMEIFIYPFHYIYDLKAYFDMLKKIHTNKILLLMSLNLDLERARKQFRDSISLSEAAGDE